MQLPTMCEHIHSWQQVLVSGALPLPPQQDYKIGQNKPVPSRRNNGELLFIKDSLHVRQGAKETLDMCPLNKIRLLPFTSKETKAQSLSLMPKAP